MRKDGQAISIINAPISIPREEMWKCAIRDRQLIDYICQFRKQLESQNIEVYARKDNTLATEQGYYSAMYNDDIRNVEGGIDNPIPYIGKDGRMKVNVKTETGEWKVTDLATIVAMAYCPNEKKYKCVLVKDANPENCNADNLIWVSLFKYVMVNFIRRFWKIKLK